MRARELETHMQETLTSFGPITYSLLCMQIPPMAQPALQRAGRPPEKPLTASLVARRWLILRQVHPGDVSRLVQEHNPDVVMCFERQTTELAQLAASGSSAQVLRVWPAAMQTREQSAGTLRVAAFRNHVKQRSLASEDLSAAPSQADIVVCPQAADPLRASALRSYIERTHPVLCVRGTLENSGLRVEHIEAMDLNVLDVKDWASVEINGNACRLLAAS